MPSNRVDVLATVACPPRLLTQLRRMSERLLEASELDGAELSVSVVGDRRMRTLNRRWRHIDRPTDVLSFPLDAPPSPAARLLGDLVVSLDTARVEARRRGHPLTDELGLYLAHGLLHLLGHDHHRPLEARRMAAAERRLLGRAGMVELAHGDGLTRPSGRSDAPRQRRNPARRP